MFKNRLMLKKITSKLDIHTSEVLKKSSASSIVKVLGIIATLAVSLILGRKLGAEGLGVIMLATRIVNVLIVLVTFGMGSVIIKEVAIAYNKRDNIHISNVLNTVYLFNGSLSVAVVICFLFLTPWISKVVFKSPYLETPLTIAVVTIIPMIFSRIHSSALIGYRKVWQSNLVNQTLSTWIVGVLIGVFILLDKTINVINVALMYASGRIIVSLAIGFYWNSLFKINKNRKIIFAKLSKMATPILIVALSNIIISNADVLFLGWLRDTREVGLYSVAAKIALLTSFFLQVTNSAVSPKVALLYEENRIIELEKMVQKVTKVLFTLGGTTFLAFILFGRILLSWWGEEFTEAYWVLVILGFGQFINLSTGAIGQIMVMTGYQKEMGKFSIYSLIISVILNMLLIYLYGIIGAASAAAISIIYLNLRCYSFVRNTIKINTIKFF